VVAYYHPKLIKMAKRKRDSDVKSADDLTLFHEIETIVKLSLLPDCLADPAAHVRRALNEMLMTYNHALGGVPVAWRQARWHGTGDTRGQGTIGGRGRVVEEGPHLHLEVVARALAFCPRPGKKAMGRVRRADAPSHVGLLVGGLFNAAVAADELAPAGWAYDDGRACWLDSTGENQLKVGDSIEFTILSLHEAAGVISLEGSMHAVSSGTTRATGGGKDNSQVSNNILATNKKENKPKKKKRKKTVTEESQTVLTGGTEMVIAEQPTKTNKKKKRKKKNNQLS